ncbi:unnamed protein product [Choristocarpus tenellus]
MMARVTLLQLLLLAARVSAYTLVGVSSRQLRDMGSSIALRMGVETWTTLTDVPAPQRRSVWLHRTAEAGGLLFSWGLCPKLATAEAFEEYKTPGGSFQLKYPASFKQFTKPLKTHKEEVNFKSEDTKGYEVGVAVDPVTIDALEKFGTPEEVGARVLKVELGKDGTLDAKLYGASSEKQSDLSLYTLDYLVESTRGVKHFLAKVTIKDKLLYVCTAQSKEKDYPEVKAELAEIVKSFSVPAL